MEQDIGNRVYTLESGAVVKVTVSEYEDAKALYDCFVMAFMAANGIDADMGSMNLIRVLIAASASKDMERALFKCAERAVYNRDGVDWKVGKTLFDTPGIGLKARGDYHVLMAKIAEANIAPFIQALFSLLKMVPALKKADSPPLS